MKILCHKWLLLGLVHIWHVNGCIYMYLHIMNCIYRHMEGYKCIFLHIILLPISCTNDVYFCIYHECICICHRNIFLLHISAFVNKCIRLHISVYILHHDDISAYIVHNVRISANKCLFLNIRLYVGIIFHYSFKTYLKPDDISNQYCCSVSRPAPEAT